MASSCADALLGEMAVRTAARGRRSPRGRWRRGSGGLHHRSFAVEKSHQEEDARELHDAVGRTRLGSSGGALVA